MSEHLEQSALIEWWRMVHARFGLPEYALFAIPNGGARHVAVAGKLKAEGVRKGVFDLCLPVPRGNHTALWIEMKFGKNRPSDDQKMFGEFVRSQGGCCAVCYGWLEAKQVIERYLDGREWVGKDDTAGCT